VFAGLNVLVMGYPCAVGISAPLSIVRGAAAERGIRMRTGEAFQVYRLVDCVVLDKTGTLTEGKPRVHEGREGELLALAVGAEAASEHPLAQAAVDCAFERGVASRWSQDGARDGRQRRRGLAPRTRGGHRRGSRRGTAGA
jgi:Cu+-exporting ATPase